MSPTKDLPEDHGDACTPMECPRCGSQGVETTVEEQRFRYGEGGDRIELSARVPVRRCGGCGFEYLDDVAEAARHEAVCAHLGVLSPGKIRSLRMSYGLSRSDFAQLTGFGEATIARWERGALVQNVANDRYLRLLASRAAFDRLTQMSEQRERAPASPRAAETTFRVLTNPAEARAAQSKFRLRKVG